VAATLALIAAFLFALAAVFQQRGALNLSEVSLRNPSSLVALARERAWLLGTAALLVGYAFQAAALDRGRLVVIQPLLVATIVFALPLGYFLTGQRVGRREVIGALAIVLGLSLFILVGNPAGGNEDASNLAWLAAFLVIGVLCGGVFFLGPRDTPIGIAGVYGTIAGVLFGLSATLTKPVVETLHQGIGEVLTDWQLYVLAVAGIGGFVLQQLSLATGRLAPSVATVSVANPVLSIFLGVFLFDERLARPLWHVAVAVIGLLVALAGAIAITFAREGAPAEEAPELVERLPDAAALPQ
jgi:drug/metabolite transporter (DMT)-like permease